MLTARGEVEDRIVGLELGADDLDQIHLSCLLYNGFDLFGGHFFLVIFPGGISITMNATQPTI